MHNLSTSEPIGDGWSILRGDCADLEWDPLEEFLLLAVAIFPSNMDMYLRIWDLSRTARAPLFVQQGCS